MMRALLGQSLIVTALLAVGLFSLGWYVTSKRAVRHLVWLRGPRARYCAALLCDGAPHYSVHSHQRQPATRYCFRHAVYQRAMMVLDGDTGSEVLDTMLDTAAQRDHRHALEVHRLTDSIPPSSMEIPSWRRT